MTKDITENSWPKHKVKSVECRKRDLVIRVTNWLSDKDEPAFDVECYVGGVYDWNKSKCFTLSSGLSKKRAKEEAVKFAQKQVERFTR
jgi:hypothetical protein